jgi:hypothetical protein
MAHFFDKIDTRPSQHRAYDMTKHSLRSAQTGACPMRLWLVRAKGIRPDFNVV